MIYTIAISLATFVPLIAATLLLRRRNRRKAPTRQREKHQAQNLSRWTTSTSAGPAPTSRRPPRGIVRDAA